MKRIHLLYLAICSFLILSNDLKAQNGYYDAPYIRYEADKGILNKATVTPRSYNQADLQSEASGQVCVKLADSAASVTWTLSAAADGLVVRYSIPDKTNGALDVYADTVLVGTLNLTTYYSWVNLSKEGYGVVNKNPKMRFDEVRMKLTSKIATGKTLKLVWKSGDIALDFAELEAIPPAVFPVANDKIYKGTGSDLATFIYDNRGKTIYLPEGTYTPSGGIGIPPNTTLKGAGMWYSEIHFTIYGGGIWGNENANCSGLYLTTDNNTRFQSYKALNGWFTHGKVENIWAEHFECGAWMTGEYKGGTVGYLAGDGYTIANCRFRNNYADGINLCSATCNTIVEHCSFRNNGDDDMATWSADGYECRNNTFRYNTSEHCWRASGCAIYGGYNNQAHHLLIKDNLEVGLRIGNNFQGSPFNVDGMHVFSDITIIGCGTFNDCFNNPVGAIDILCSAVAGTRINNVKFSNISITDSKNDAIYIYKIGGEGFYNLVFENITSNGTGKEYPYNDVNNLQWGRGYGILFVGSPTGNGTYCNMSYTGRGGNASQNVNSSQIGTFSWVKNICGTPTGISEEVPELFNIFPNPVSDLFNVNTLVTLREFTIYDATGRIVYNLLNPENNFSIKSENFAAGFYTAVLTDIDFKKHSFKFIK